MTHAVEISKGCIYKNVRISFILNVTFYNLHRLNFGTLNVNDFKGV